LNITQGISLIGAGIGQTVISRSGSNDIIDYQPSNYSLNTPFRISSFTFDMGGNGGIAIILNTNLTSNLVVQSNVRLDHNRFQNIPITSTADHYIVFAGIRGVIDNNVFGRVFYPFRATSNIQYRDSAGNLISGGAAEWNNLEGIVFGKADNNIFFEDNVFEELTSGGSGVAMSDCQYGSRYAFRYNTINITGSGQPLFDMHGNQGQYFYACMGGEIYGNNITGGGGTLLDHRGGRAFVFNNNAASSMSIQVREEFADSITPVNYVGLNALQYSQHVNGSYYWGNRTNLTGSLITANVNTTCSQCTQNGLVENVDFWQDSKSFNGSLGIGCGTLAARPSTCTTGVGYWATNQSCTNLTGMVGDHPAAAIAGTLYRCTDNKTWDSGSTPLPYPHPLIDRASSSPLPPYMHMPVLNPLL
jgi:hypothetical protein